MRRCPIEQEEREAPHPYPNTSRGMQKFMKPHCVKVRYSTTLIDSDIEAEKYMRSVYMPQPTAS